MHSDIRPDGVRLDSPNGDKIYNAEVMGPDWFNVFSRIEHGDIEGEMLLRGVPLSGLRLILRRESSRGIEQVLDAAAAGTILAIRSRQLRDAQHIPSFLLKEGRRCLLQQPAAPPSENEHESQKAPNNGLLKACLAGLTPKERELLRQYYVLGLEPAIICAESGVPQAAFSELVALVRQNSKKPNIPLERR